ncbi:nitroreductase family protein [Fuchsiella alkaliacetigena]|uniref:nitroreductase family protein n=1 Tax=Fuchsiella alkaliacetigena TaxID=957042 RepID=UPI00200A1D20|nr:nitroreductase family protein [Fuchsiella alkaliacetigena]MCK8823966.1 nitroreductase family protein [Fuchsiella alkaliacetigena]
MKVQEAIKTRRSIRGFKSTKISDEKLNQILEAGRLAPSGTNIQPWRFLVVESVEMREKLKSYTLNFVAEAPVVIVCCVDRSSIQHRKKRILELHKVGAFAGTELARDNLDSYKPRSMNEEEQNNYLYLNCAIAIQNMVLQATELGLGSCWIMMFNSKKTKKLFKLADSLEPIALLPIGYPAKNPEPRPRFSLEKIIIDRV